MNDELQGMWEEADVAYLNKLSHHLLEAVRKTTKTSHTAVSVPAGIQTRHLLNTR